jgi:hypothetical protein
MRILAVAAILLLACISISGVSSLSIQGSETPTTGKQLACLNANAVEQIRANPQTLISVYTTCVPEFSARVSPLHLNESALRQAFAVIAAHSMAPYGNSTVFHLPALLSEPALDCDNYAALSGHFIRILATSAAEHVVFVGVDGGAVGNHAQMFLSAGDHRMILADPTIGLLADEGFDDLFRGIPLAADRIAVIPVRVDPVVEPFRRLIFNAVRDGSYRPSDLLYYLAGLDEFLSFSERIGGYFARTPIDISPILEAMTTPASPILKHHLSAH